MIIEIFVHPEGTCGDRLELDLGERLIFNIVVSKTGGQEGINNVLCRSDGEVLGGGRVIEGLHIDRHGVLLCREGESIMHLEEEGGVVVTQCIGSGTEAEFGDVRDGDFIVVLHFFFPKIEQLILIMVDP